MQKLKVLNHFHTDFSKFDSAALVEDMVKRAYEYGVEACAISEHGNMASLEPFLDACKRYHIKAIPGVEAYFEDERYPFKRSHLILYAVNETGYHQIAKAISASNERIIRKMPLMDFNLLGTYFGPGSAGYGNVIATSACVSGILAQILLYNGQVEKKNLAPLLKFKEKYNIDDIAQFKSSCAKQRDYINVLKERLNSLRKLRNEAKRISEKKFTMLEKRVNRLKGTEGYEASRAALEHDKRESQDAKRLLEQYEDMIQAINAKITVANREYKPYKDKEKRLDVIEHDREEGEMKKYTAEQINTYVDRYIQNLLYIFGDNFYIEIQNHGMSEEYDIMNYLIKKAQRFHIPLMAANDAHMVGNSKEDIRAREIMTSLRFEKAKWNPLSNPEKELYIKTEKELEAAISKLGISDSLVSEAIAGMNRLSELCDVSISHGEHYPKYSNEPGFDADKMLREETYRGLYEKYKKPSKEYVDCIEHELQVIQSMGYSDYHLIEKDLLEVGRKIGSMPVRNFRYLQSHAGEMDLDVFLKYIEDHQGYVGYTIGPGRGSAAGSLVCMCLGITDIDPIENGLLFERFLNPERVSMPDIDSDIASYVRPLLIEYVKKKYGEHSICCIMTEGRYQLSGAIKASARVVGSRYFNDEKYLYSLADAMTKIIPDKIEKLDADGIPLFDKDGNMEMAPCKTISQCQNLILREFPNDTKIVSEILYNAGLIQNRLFNYGMHAAGVVIADNGDIREYIPLMYNNKQKQFTSQCDMVKIEDNGLLKMDFLGLRNLDIITDAVRLIYERRGIRIELETISFEDMRVYRNIFQTGNTNSVFQLESNGMKEMLKQFKPSCFKDLILLVAAYRPGPMQYLPDIISVKHGKKKPEYLVPELENVLSETYAAIIYQEQVQQIFQILAGYSLGQADLVRRAMSKKKEKILAKERHAFVYGDETRNIIGCVNHGISETVANQLFDEMMKFAAYAFNKSHAAAYAKLAYITAYLKEYYPMEYFTAMFNHTETKKYQPIYDDLKAYGIELLAPGINRSKSDFVISQDKIVFGLSHIPNIGEGCQKILSERLSGEFLSFRDFYTRTRPNKKLFDNLLKTGAFDCFGNRVDIAKEKAYIDTCLKDISSLERSIEKADKDFLSAKTDKKKEKLMMDRKHAMEQYKEKHLELESFHVVSGHDDIFQNLKEEYESVGTFLSGHPTDYLDDKETVSKVIASRQYRTGNKITMSGVILNTAVVFTRKDHKQMAFFDFEDRWKRIRVICFPGVFEKMGSKLKDFTVVKITCKSAERNGEICYYLENICEEMQYHSKIFLEIDETLTAEEAERMIQPYLCENGHTLLVYAKMRKILYFAFKGKPCVSEGILHDKHFHAVKVSL